MGRIAVLGGGPGGGSAALALARGGAEVDLYLPARPGEKPCGGAVPEHVLPRIAGFDPEDLPRVLVSRARLENDRGGGLDLSMEGIQIYRRGDLDRALVAAAETAGARVLRERAERIEWQGDEVLVATSDRFRRYTWAVGADGARGLSRRGVGLQPQGESVGLGASLRGFTAERLVLCFLEVGDAYAWVFPRPGGVSVGIAYSTWLLADRTARAAFVAFCDRALPRGWQDLPGPRYRYPIPVFGPWTLPGVRRALGRRLLLVGDAAATADPLTREGIRFSLLSGLWAAESLLAGQPETYVRRLSAELADEMARAEVARDLFFEGSVGRWMVPAARIHRGVRRVLSDLLACRQPYRGLQRRLLQAAVGLA